MTSIDQLAAKADAAIAADRGHMNFAGTDRSLSWLVAQLACWPNRVDEEKTTNLRFLMVSAAVTLRSLEKALRRLQVSCDSGSDRHGENSRSEVECEASQSGGAEGAASPTP